MKVAFRNYEMENLFLLMFILESCLCPGRALTSRRLRGEAPLFSAPRLMHLVQPFPLRVVSELRATSAYSIFLGQGR